MAFDPKELREKLLEIRGVKRVQIDTVRQIIIETSTGRDRETIAAVHNTEIEIIKQNPTEVFDFSILYGDSTNIVRWDSNR